jgi:hypothetical protein
MITGMEDTYSRIKVVNVILHATTYSRNQLIVLWRLEGHRPLLLKLGTNKIAALLMEHLKKILSWKSEQ